MKVVICDSSILILLSKLDMLDSLLSCFEKIMIPIAVYKEVVKEGKKLKKLDSYIIESKIKDKKIKIMKIKNHVEKKNLMENFNIHFGEAEAIRLYLENNGDLFGTDDFRTLKVCKILDINYFSTLSFILQCRSKDLISKDNALLKLDRLEKIGWYKNYLISESRQKIMNEEI